MLDCSNLGNVVILQSLTNRNCMTEIASACYAAEESYVDCMYPFDPANRKLFGSSRRSALQNPSRSASSTTPT